MKKKSDILVVTLNRVNRRIIVVLKITLTLVGTASQYRLGSIGYMELDILSLTSDYISFPGLETWHIRRLVIMNFHNLMWLLGSPGAANHPASFHPVY